MRGSPSLSPRKQPMVNSEPNRSEAWVVSEVRKGLELQINSRPKWLVQHTHSARRVVGLCKLTHELLRESQLEGRSGKANHGDS